MNVNLTCGPRETTRLVRALLPESFVAEDAFVLLRRILDIWTSTALDTSGGALLAAALPRDKIGTLRALYVCTQPRRERRKSRRLTVNRQRCVGANVEAPSGHELGSRRAG